MLHTIFIWFSFCLHCVCVSVSVFWVNIILAFMLNNFFKFAFEILFIENCQSLALLAPLSPPSPSSRMAFYSSKKCWKKSCSSSIHVERFYSVFVYLVFYNIYILEMCHCRQDLSRLNQSFILFEFLFELDAKPVTNYANSRIFFWITPFLSDHFLSSSLSRNEQKTQRIII